MFASHFGKQDEALIVCWEILLSMLLFKRFSQGLKKLENRDKLCPSHVGSFLNMNVKLLSRARLFAILCTITYQAPQSMEFSRQEYWSGLPFHSPGDLPNPGIELLCPALADGFFTTELPGKLKIVCVSCVNYQKLCKMPQLRENCWGVCHLFEARPQ